MWFFCAFDITPGLAIQFGSSTFFHGASKSSSSAIFIFIFFYCEVTFSLFSVMMIVFFLFFCPLTNFLLLATGLERVSETGEKRNENEMFGGKGWGGKKREIRGLVACLPLSYPVLYACQRALLLP